MPAANQPIGIFDSGIGGMTIAHTLSEHLPDENFIYFGDTLHLPYGDKSPEAIKRYTRRIVSFLQEKGCKAVIIACNSASSTALEEAQQVLKPDRLLVNVIDPVIHEIAQESNLHKDVLIGTERTVRSGMYEEKMRSLNDSIDLVSMATPLLAPMIEAGFFDNTISQQVIHQYLSNERFQDIDALILACTHYPLIREEIQQFFGDNTPVYDSTQAVIRCTKQLLEEHNLINSSNDSPTRHFFVSDYSEAFEQTTHFFYNETVQLEACPIWTEETGGASKS